MIDAPEASEGSKEGPWKASERVEAAQVDDICEEIENREERNEVGEGEHCCRVCYLDESGMEEHGYGLLGVNVGEEHRTSREG